MKKDRINQQKSKRQINQFAIIILFAATICGWLPVTKSNAGELISCKYEQAEGNQIKLKLEIGAPPPAMLILIQRIPEGITISKANPPISKYNHKRGEAKWLLKHLKPGSINFTMTLNDNIRAEQISGEIRYKIPGMGKMKIMTIKP